jgi:hypothetical protein
MVATLDIKDFYPSTSPGLIEPVLRQAGFAGQALQDLIALLTLHGALAQGSPSSCFLANMALVLEERSNWKWCRERRLVYSRFVDDIAISGDWDFRQHVPALISRIEASPYKIAGAKVFTRLQGQRQVVTGLVVNDKLRPTKTYIVDLRHDIRLCLSHGAQLVAEANGMTKRKLQQKLNGRIAHIRQFDAKIAKHLSGMMCDVHWLSDTYVGVDDELCDINAELSEVSHR